MNLKIILTTILINLYLHPVSTNNLPTDPSSNSTTMPAQEEVKPNPRPIIGILAHRYDETWHGKNKFEYIPASYIKLVEGGGGRVVPIRASGSSKYLRRMFNSVNGLILPGGVVSLRSSAYARAGNYMMNLAIKAFKNGVYFPVWGECLGFQFMLDRAAGANTKLRDHCGSDNVGLSLNFTEESKQSRLFGRVPKTILKYLSKKPVTTHSHHLCVSLDSFLDSGLDKIYRPLSTNWDEKTRIIFVSSVEHRKYPFYGLGFHPEKNLYEWGKLRKIPHTSEACECSQYFAHFLVDEARKNSHRFETDEEEEKNLIYNYSPEFTDKYDDWFTQIYFFP